MYMDMAKKRKHAFHCQRCNSELQIYKKGKAHRVLVCPQCGILATNPFSFKGALRGGVSAIPIAGGILNESGLTDMILGSDTKKSSPLPAGDFARVPRRAGYPLNEKVHDALSR